MRKCAAIVGSLLVTVITSGWIHGIPVLPPATNTWQNIFIGGGGLVVGTDIPPTGIRFARTDTAGLYIWNTSTNKWWQLASEQNMPPCPTSGPNLGSVYCPYTGIARQPILGGGALEVAGCWADATKAYAFIGGHVLVSTNISASNPASIRFTDADGITFTPVTDTNAGFRQYGKKMAVDPYNCDHVIVGTQQGGLWETLNGTNAGGATWTQVPSGSIPVATGGRGGPGYNIAFDGSSAGGSTGGIANKAYIWSGGNVGLYATTNMGVSGSAAAATWAVAGGGGPSANIIKSLIVNPATIGAGDVWLVENGGNSVVWNLSGGVWTNEINSSDPPRSVAVNALNGNHVVALAGSGNLFIDTNGKAGPFTKFSFGGQTSTEAPWLQTYGGLAFPTGSQIAFDPLSTNGDVLIAGVGQSVSTIPFASVGASFFWVTQVSGIENLVSRTTIAPKNNFVVGGVEDEGVFRMIPSPGTAPAVQSQTAQSHSLTAAYGLAVSLTDPNFMVASVTNNNGGFADYSGSSTDGFATFTPFSSWNANIPGNSANIGQDTTSPCSVGSPCVKLTLPGGITPTGLVSWAPGTGINSLLCSTLLDLPAVGVANTVLNTGNCFSIRVNIDNTITLLQTVYSASMLGASYNYAFWTPSGAVSNQWNSLTILNVTNNGTGGIRITSPARPGQIGQPMCIFGVVMSGATVVNGCWITSVRGTATYDLQGSTFVGGDTYTTGGYATTLPAGGGGLAAASDTNIVRIGNLNDYPFCTVDGGATWYLMQFPANFQKATVDNNGPYTGNTFTIASGSVGSGGTILVQLTSGRWLQSVETNTGGVFTLVTGTPPGDSIPSGAVVTSGGTGWGFAANGNFQNVAADWVTPNTFYGYNANYGMYKWTGCGSTSTTPNNQTVSIPGGGTNPVLMSANGAWSTSATFGSVIKTVPGEAGHFYFTVGGQNCGNNCHPNSEQLTHSCDGGATMTFAESGFFEPQAVGVGAKKPGTSYGATIFVVGFYDPNWATDGASAQANSLFGIWRQTDNPNHGVSGPCIAGGTWQKLGNQMISATAGWTTSNTNIVVTSCISIVAGMSVYSNSRGALIGRVATCVGTTLTLASTAVVASAGLADQLAIGDLPVGWPIQNAIDITGDPGDYTRVYLAGNGVSFFFGSFN